jgi:hypothetical protein
MDTPWHRHLMSGPSSLILSLLMVAALALGGGGAWVIARRRDYKRGLLMIAAGAVMLGNVLVWTL